MSGYAQDTSVSVERSRAEIETILAKYGAKAFAYMTSETHAVIGFQGWRRRWWQRENEIPFPDWKTKGVP